MRIIFSLLLSLSILPTCKTKSALESSPVKSEEDKTIEKLLSGIKAYPISDKTEAPKKETLGLTPWVHAFDEFFNSRIGKSIDTPIMQKSGISGKVLNYISPELPYQKKIWNEAIDDWKNGVKYDPQDMNYLISNYNTFKTVISDRKDFKILADFSKIKNQGFKKEGVLIQGPKHDNKDTFALILRKKDGSLLIREVDFNPATNRIVVHKDNYYRVEGTENKTGGVVSDLTTLREDLSNRIAVTSSVHASENLERTVNKFLEHLFEEKRVNLNGFLNDLNRKNAIVPYSIEDELGQAFTSEVKNISERLKLSDDIFEEEAFQTAFEKLSLHQKEEVLSRAAKFDQTPIVRQILDSTDINEHTVRWSLLNAIKAGHPDSVELLLRKKSISHDYFFWEYGDKRQMFELALKSGNRESVELLLKDSRFYPYYESNPLLMELVKDGNREVVELMLKDKRFSLETDVKKAIKAKWPDLIK